MRKQSTRSRIIIVLGAALLAGAAPISLLAAPPQAKTPPPTKQSTPAKKTTKKKKPARPRAQRAPTPDRIREIQAALAQKGFYEGEPNGKWDARSVQAMKKFQEANGLTATGKVGARTLQKLGLGSEIAGSAPPRPVPGVPNNPRPPQ